MAAKPSLVNVLCVIAFIATGGVEAYRRNPLKDPDICGRPYCDESQSKFLYKSDIIYRYDYVMQIKSEFQGSGQNSSEIHVIAAIEMTFPRKCEGVMRITSVEVKDKIPLPPRDETNENFESDDYVEPEEIPLHPKSDEIGEDISRYEIRFAFHDGLINELCPHADEPSWVLNVKKGIMSSMQNTMNRFDVDHYSKESDISGECEVNYHLIGNKDTSLIIKKSKIIETCKHRNRMHSLLQTTPYDFRQNYAAWPVLRSESYCNISIDHFIYNQVLCYERHQVVPFSNGDSGAVTTSVISLTLADEEAIDKQHVTEEEEFEAITKRSPLYFDHSPSKRPTHGEIKASRDYLKDMCRLGFPDIQREFPDVFSKFLSASRYLTHPALSQLLARASSICENGKNHVMESLPYISSTASVQVMKDQIIKGAIPKETVQKWMSSLSFLPRPDEEMVAAMFSLMEFGHGKHSFDFILTPSAVAHTFCKYHEECHNNGDIIKMLEYLEGVITSTISKPSLNRQDKETVMVALKGLGNIGIVNEEFQEELQNIIEDDQLPLEIRLEAITIHRRLDCDDTKDYFLGIYRNFTMNSEIRIASYLQAMRCPDYGSIQYIKDVLENEEVNQVGSYVWSHLANLAKASSPVKVEAQGLLIDGDLKSKYKMDIRKFSRNFEHSIFFDEYNFGMNSDSNFIFSTDSYMPRAASFNFTVDLFGESVNLLELSTRMEGFEHFVESIFGPKGPLNRDRFREKFSFLSNTPLKGDSEDDLKLDAFDMRFKREVDPKEELKNSVDSLGFKPKAEFNEPKASFGVKIFGNDLKYVTMDGFAEVAQTAAKLNPMAYIRELLSGREITYTKSGVFLDLSYAIPMTSGIPLSITAMGASSIDLRMSGHMEASNFIKHRRLDVDFRLKPSVSLDVVTTMKADFFQAFAGIKVKSNLYSSSSVETKLKIRGTKLVSFQFSLPQDRNDIFSASSELLVIKYDRDIPQKGITRRYTNSTCTWPVIDRAIGLKLCADYSLPDVSNQTNVPSLILSGPIKIDIHVDKADPTAKVFLFECRWESLGPNSEGSFIFQTPNTKIQRIFSANLTRSAIGNNMTMVFRNGDIAHSMVSIYKNTEREKRLEVTLDLNGQKSLALEIGYNRTDHRNGHIYYPVFYLTVNDEKVAGLVGEIKLTSKKNVNQWDLNLLFETKRLQTMLNGYFTKTTASISTKLNMKYQFLDQKQETVEIEGELANRSQRGQVDYEGNTKLQSSAYPQFNFAFDTKYIAAMGHMDWVLRLNNAPDLIDSNYTLTTRIVFARHHNSDTGRTTASIEITRPKSKTDLKASIEYDEKSKNGTEHMVRLLGRYATGKEITAVLSVLLPRKHVFGVDVALNITVPALDSCTATFKLLEKDRKEYSVDFSGTWFSGHSITAKGHYKDRSSAIKTFHHLKLNVQSPSFEETLIDATYARDESEVHIDLKAEYGNQPYGFNFKYSEETVYQTITYVAVKWREKLYTCMANMTSQQPKQLVVEIHLDKYRDIHVILRGLSNEFKKEAGMEFRWDANRDPSQKLVLSAEFNTPNSRSFNGRLILAYPERTFSGTFDYSPGEPVSMGHARLGWSSSEAIELKYENGHRFGNDTDLWLKVQLTTPFDGWKKNNLDTGLYYYKNLLLANSSMIWAEDQNLSLEVMGDYEIQDPIFSCEIKTALNSTIEDVPTVSLHLKHRHDNKRIDTDATIKHSAINEIPQTFSLKSGWQFDINHGYYNVSGSLGFRSPFEGYTTGALVTKFSLSDKKMLKGAADFDLEEKKFTLTVEGHIRKLTDNMLQMNITTPIEKFRTIVGRFGINERDRHAVAEVRAPNGALGVEILFNIISSSNFDIRFLLATPFEAFEKIMLIGVINNEKIDFRGGWNEVNLGFVGVWRLVSFTDFEYSYKLYTPLENFEDNGVVIKFVKKEEVDLELTLKLAKYKLGVILTAKPKPKLVKQLRLINTHEIIDKLFPEEDDDDEEEEEEVDEPRGSQEQDEDDEELLNFMAYMELDTIVYPTLKGTLDFEEVEDTYFSFGTLILPQGMIEIRDRFYFPDYFTMKNTLRITTPFQLVKEIRSKYELKTDLSRKYVIGINLNFLNRTNWVETGVRVNYTTGTDKHELKTHDCQLEIKTPLKLMPFLNIRGSIELEDNIYRGNLTGITKTTRAQIFGALESDDTYIDAVLGFSLQAPVVPQYDCKVFFKRDLSEFDNSFELGIEVADQGDKDFVLAEGTWSKDKPHYLSASGKVKTTLLLVKEVHGMVLITRSPNPQAQLKFGYRDFEGNTKEFKAKASRKLENVDLELQSPIDGFQNLSIHGVLMPNYGHGPNQVKGNMYLNSLAYNIEGQITLVNDIPMHISVVLHPVEVGAKNGSLTYTVNQVDGNYGYTFQGRIARDAKYVQVGGGISHYSNFNWAYVVSVISSEPQIGRLALNCTMSPDESGKLNAVFDMTSPWKHLGMEFIKIQSSGKISADKGDFTTNYEIPSVKGYWHTHWSWLILEDMVIMFENRAQSTNGKPRLLRTSLKYVNPQKNFQQLNLGAELNLDDVWKLQTNGSLNFITAGDITFLTSVYLPKPVGDVHRLSARYRGNAGAQEPIDISYEAKYEAEEAKTRLASRGQYRNTADLQGLFRFEWGPDMRHDAIEANLQMLRKRTKKEFAARVATPYHLEDSVKASGSYDYQDIYHMLAGKLFIPASKQVGEADVAFSSLSNTKGMVNTTTPFLNVTWFKTDFEFTTKGGDSIRNLKGTWPSNFALFNSKSKFVSKNLNRDLTGQIKIELPLTTRHFADIDYSIKERPQLTTGTAVVNYNKQKVLNGKYTCKTESSAGFDKEVIDIELENKYKPVGVHYVHSRQFAGPDDPDYDMKHGELFELGNSGVYNITGEFHLRTTITGQEYKIVAIHPNRTVILTSEYDYENSTTKQSSKLQLAPTIWLAYDWHIQNLTRVDNESQVFSLELSYPKRSLGAFGWYAVTENTFDSDISLKWHNKDTDEDMTEEETSPKIMKAALMWRNNPLVGDDKDNQTAMFSLGHPSFEKDITVKGLWYRSKLELLKTSVVADYCDDPYHLLTFDAVIKDNSPLMGYNNYTFFIKSIHEISELNLDVDGSVGIRPGLYETSSTSSYKRGYLPLQEGILVGILDMKGREIFYHKTSPHKVSKFWGKAGGQYPMYSVNATVEDSPDTDMIGAFMMNFDDKLIRLNVNLTPDATQNLRLLGVIPDARSASFDLWRDYEDIHVVDIASYIRMNHSRLVTSKIIWRPQMKSDIKVYVKNMAASFYESLSEGIDFWIKTIYTETVDTINDVWSNAKPYTKDFIEDLDGLKVLEDDMETFRKFLNASYQANDFYIRSAVNFTVTLIDELAIRNHIETVPKIFSEIWQVMGESGQALRRSILWIFETIKTSYRKAVDLMTRIIHGESLEHLSVMMEKMVERYDKFIKDLHLSIIKYVENMYNKVTGMMSSYWKRLLHNIEPSIIKFAHYVETMMWNISKEVFDFLYKRTNELVESPYFNKVSNFTQDLDRLYRDIMQNDAITNIKKYTALLYEFLKEKYFKLVPFSKEIRKVYLELKEEVETLKQSTYVQFVLLRVQEVQAKIDWLANELQVEQRVLQMWTMLKTKLMRMAQTALQADSQYREAKTKFIFDPDAGLIDLEQKLPMSWHSFNTTPKFEEIPEYKLVGDIQSYFAGTNFSVWSLYYEYKRYMDPNTWLPPFKAQSLIIGSRHYLTFDNRLVPLNAKYGIIRQDRKPDQCSYLLANDWFDRNFTLALEPSILNKNSELVATRKLSMITDNQLISIDVIGQAVRIGKNSASLPLQLEDAIIYRYDDILNIESDKGFTVKCNLQFDICSLELEGWYFGKTAGLLGTMNNEKFDDTVTSQGRFSSSEDEFVKSWALNGCQSTPKYEPPKSLDLNIVNTCDNLFRNKVSYFAPCFPVVDPLPFYTMCLDLLENSFTNFIPTENPSPKGACTAALAYIEVCNMEKTPLRIPDLCIYCELINGTYVNEGVFITMKDEEVPKTTDVVFIVEAKDCNRNLTGEKSMATFVNILSHELQEAGLQNNRFAVVTFGGSKPFDKPRSIVVNNEVFAEAKFVGQFFDHLKVDQNGTNRDIFQAISVASNLVFRPGAAKTFILLPCSQCQSRDMRFDYSSLLQLMLENGITLHILTDQELTFDKSRTGKMFYGMDKERAYSKNDLKEFKGNTELRKQVRLPKSSLHLCAPLALETNGTVFTSKKLRPDRKNPIKKFSSVFAKRIALTAVPNNCQTCECTGHNTGVSYMTCFPCNFPSPTSMDYGFNEDEMLEILQPDADFDNLGDEDYT